MAPLAGEDVSALLNSMVSSAKHLAKDQPGAREQLLSRAYELITQLETPSESIQRMGWAEVR